MLKIENVAAFENLPELLLTAMRSPSVGVMIARGDLAVEVGFERLAEVQEEIMWACEAAHVPVIWATQVLDTLARTGQPSRAEVTDAAMAERAECVMLNKGPHIADAISALDSILTRMQDHQDKKRSLLRRLRAWTTSSRLGDQRPATGRPERADRPSLAVIDKRRASSGRMLASSAVRLVSTGATPAYACRGGITGSELDYMAPPVDNPFVGRLLSTGTPVVERLRCAAGLRRAASGRPRVDQQRRLMGHRRASGGRRVDDVHDVAMRWVLPSGEPASANRVLRLTFGSPCGLGHGQ